MTLPRKAYKDKIDRLMPLVLEYWCLVHYSTIMEKTDRKTELG